MTLGSMAAATAAAAFLLTAGAADANILHYQAVLKGANETPTNANHGRGHLNAVLNTDQRTLDYTVTFSGLSGPATTAAFQRRGVATGVSAPPPAQGSAIHASATLTAEQINDLNAGRWSFYVGTKANPQGEIEGVVWRSSGDY